MINERLRKFRADLRVLDAEGKLIGIMRVNKALDMARDQNLDLILVTEQADMPVVKILDYGKFKYDEAKRAKESKKKVQDVKGIQISPRIAENDLKTHIVHATKFLGEGDKVRVVCKFRAREITHPELGKAQLEKLADALKDIGVVEAAPKLDGKAMVMVITPKK